MKWRFAVLTATICASLLLLHSEVRGSTYAEFYFVSGADGSGFFCMTNGLHDQYHAFDLTKYGGNACIHTGNGNLGDAVAVRTAGYTASGTATLRSSWYTGEYADLCDYAYGGLTSIADGLSRGTVRYIHSRYPNATGFYGTLDLPASTGGTAFSWGVANLTTDNNCRNGLGWTGYHVHQDMRSTCLVDWSSLTARDTPYQTWPNLIHKLTYTEGIGCP